MLLAIETACTGCSVAILQKDNAGRQEILAYMRDGVPLRQAAHLVPMVEQAMAQAGIQFEQLTDIAVTVGPGSFTGIRIGLATARAFSIATGIAVTGITTLAAMAAAAHLAHPQAKRILATVEAGRGEVYAQAFVFCSNLNPEGTAAMIPAAEAAVLGQGCDITTRENPDARAVAWLAALGNAAFFHPPEPFYIRLPNAKPLAG